MRDMFSLKGMVENLMTTETAQRIIDKAVETFGRVGILVNNAKIIRRSGRDG